MSKILKQNLPSKFKKDSNQKGAYCIENDNICSSVLLRKVKLYDSNNINDNRTFKYVFELTVSVLDKFSELFDEGIYKIVILASLEDKEIEPINNSFDAYNWDLNDEEGLLEALNKIIIPWLEKYSNLEVVIEYLIALENVALGKTNDFEISQFGKLITGDLIFPIRLMKSHNGIIATLYEHQCDYESALIHLKMHKEFVIEDHPSNCKVKSMNENFKKRLFLIDQGISQLKINNS